MDSPGPIRKEYHNLIFKLTVMGKNIVKARKLLSTPIRRRGWLLWFCGISPKTAILALVLVLVGGTGLASGPVAIHNGFYTGNDYIKLVRNDKAQYAMGLIDGMLLSPLFGAEKRKLGWLEKHIEGMENYQLVAIIDKYLKENPEHWHESMHTLAYRALAKAFQK